MDKTECILYKSGRCAETIKRSMEGKYEVPCIPDENCELEETDIED